MTETPHCNSCVFVTRGNFFKKIVGDSRLVRVSDSKLAITAPSLNSHLHRGSGVGPGMSDEDDHRFVAFTSPLVSHRFVQECLSLVVPLPDMGWKAAAEVDDSAQFLEPMEKTSLLPEDGEGYFLAVEGANKDQPLKKLRPTSKDGKTSRKNVKDRLWAEGGRTSLIPKEAVLGTGTYGIVWRAKRDGDGSESSDSVVRPTTHIVRDFAFNRWAPLRQEFQCTVDDAPQVEAHPCLMWFVRVIFGGEGQQDPLRFAITEHIHGPSQLALLRQRVQSDNSFSVDENLENWQFIVFAQIFSGLEYLHKYGMAHGSFCPKVVLFTEPGRIKITGQECQLSDLRLPGPPLPGNFGYLAPELFQKESGETLSQEDLRAQDCYALGVSLTVAWTGGVDSERTPQPPIRKVGRTRDHVTDCELLVAILARGERGAAGAEVPDGGTGQTSTFSGKVQQSAVYSSCQVRRPISQAPAWASGLARSLTTLEPSQRCKLEDIREKYLKSEKLVVPSIENGFESLETWIGKQASALKPISGSRRCS